MPKAKKEIQGERTSFRGKEFVKIKPITFQNAIKVTDLCEDIKSTLIDFAITFGADKDVPLEKVFSFLEDDGWDNWNKNFKWLKEHKFIKEVEVESYKLTTRFYDKKKELMLISTGFGHLTFLDLSTGKCPYESVETAKANSISRTELWELLNEFNDTEFAELLKTAH